MRNEGKEEERESRGRKEGEDMEICYSSMKL